MARTLISHLLAASRTAPARRRGASGFTLIELMIVVAVIGILAAIAYPSYQNAVLKGRRAEGRTALLNLLQQEERYLTQNGSYMTFDSSTSGSIPFRRYSGDGDGTDAAYVLGARACSATLSLKECVVVFGRPTAAKPDPVVQELTVSSTGLKSCTATDQSICWQ